MRKFLLSAVMMLMVALFAQIANATTLSLPCTGTNSTPGTFQDITCTFTLPSGKSFTGLSGKFSITQSNGAGNLGEALLLLWTAPSGQTCDLAHRQSPGFGAYIVKTMNANGTQDTSDISLSEVTNEGVRLNVWVAPSAVTVDKLRSNGRMRNPLYECWEHEWFPQRD